MILLSTIINQFRTTFLDRRRNVLLPGHRKALHAMALCRQEHGPHIPGAM